MTEVTEQQQQQGQKYIHCLVNHLLIVNQLFLMKKQWISLFFIIDLNDPDIKDLNDPDPHLELDILECKVKRGLGSITMNKPRGDDGIPAELFQIWKDYVKVLHSICQQIWKTQQRPSDWKRPVFIPIPKKGNAKECSKYWTVALISHASRVMLKILQAWLQ